MSSTYQQLLRRYDRPCLPLAEVREEWLPHYRHDSSLLRAIRNGRVTLRVTLLQRGRYTHRVVYLRDLAAWLDAHDPSNTQPVTHQVA